MNKSLILLTLMVAAIAAPLRATQKTRLKDLVSLEGVRDNQLVGYGLVVGLKGTGDRQTTIFSVQSLTNMLQQMGVSTPPTGILVQDTAAVMVTATLPPFAQPGMKIDATVAAIGDANNLQGGILIMTSLRGVDGQIYSMVQGPVLTGGFVAGRGGNSQTVNHPTVGRIPGGALVERPSPTIEPTGSVRLQLNNADFMTASRITAAVNQEFSAKDGAIAHADNSGVVSVKIPSKYASNTTEFIAELEKLEVVADQPARVVVNERTGTVVMGKEVHVAPVAIMHGNLVVEIQTQYQVSQPEALSAGQTQVVPQVGINGKEQKASNVMLKNGATVEELVRALGAIGSTPRDIIAILQSLKSAGALEAELDVI